MSIPNPSTPGLGHGSFAMNRLRIKPKQDQSYRLVSFLIGAGGGARPANVYLRHAPFMEDATGWADLIERLSALPGFRADW